MLARAVNKKEPMGPLGGAVLNMGSGHEHAWHGLAGSSQARRHQEQLISDIGGPGIRLPAPQCSFSSSPSLLLSLSLRFLLSIRLFVFVFFLVFIFVLPVRAARPSTRGSHALRSLRWL